MTPETQAVRDRLLWEGALLVYLLSRIPRADLDREVPATGWTVRQTFGHLGMGNERQAGILRQVLDEGEVTAAMGGHPDEAERLAPFHRAPVASLTGYLSRARAELREQLARVDEGSLDREVKPGLTVRDAARRWAGHYAEHAWHILELFPDVRTDPLIAGWLLYVDHEADGRPELRERQEHLIEELRALIRQSSDE